MGWKGAQRKKGNYSLKMPFWQGQGGDKGWRTSKRDFFWNDSFSHSITYVGIYPADTYAVPTRVRHRAKSGGGTARPYSYKPEVSSQVPLPLNGVVTHAEVQGSAEEIHRAKSNPLGLELLVREGGQLL